jgi:membrane protease YdiL (CAAX protease family)
VSGDDGNRWDVVPGAGEVPLVGTDESALAAVARAGGLAALGIVLLAVVSAIASAIGVGLGLSTVLVFGLGTAIGQYVGFIGLAVSYLQRRGLDREGIRSYLGVRWPTLREVGIVFAGYLALVLLLLVAAAIAQLLLPEGAENQGAAAIGDANSPLVYVGALAFMFLVVGPSEEVLYRGVVQNRIRETLSPVPAIIIASGIFAAVHVIALAGSLTAMLTTVTILLVPGIVLGVVYEYTGNIVVPAVLHGTHNSILITLLFFGPGAEENATLVPALIPLLVV